MVLDRYTHVGLEFEDLRHSPELTAVQCGSDDGWTRPFWDYRKHLPEVATPNDGLPTERYVPSLGSTRFMTSRKERSSAS